MGKHKRFSWRILKLAINTRILCLRQLEIRKNLTRSKPSICRITDYLLRVRSKLLKASRETPILSTFLSIQSACRAWPRFKATYFNNSQSIFFPINFRLKELNLEGNKLGDIPIKIIIDSLLKKEVKLKKLNIGLNLITDQIKTPLR